MRERQREKPMIYSAKSARASASAMWGSANTEKSEERQGEEQFTGQRERKREERSS
jgi:hypothetical protein